MPSRACATAAIVMFCAMPVPRLLATPVAPGQTIGFDANTFAIPAGALVAETTRDFQLVYTPPPGMAFGSAQEGGPFTGTLHSRVLRDPATSHLSFVYEVTAFRNASQPLGNESSAMTVESFSNFATDAAVQMGGDSSLTIARSGDGSLLTFTNNDPGTSAVPTTVVQTDATSFDTEGRLTVQAGDEFLLVDPAFPDSGATATFLAANATFEGVYQPAVVGVAIPLPSSACAATVGLAAAAAVCKPFRRRGC
jgi:hypothetical protein